MKITQSQVERRIRDTRYMYDGSLTICIIELDNGFKAVGESACADPAEYNQQVGETLARSRAMSDVWKVLGYALMEQLARSSRFSAASKTGNSQENRMALTKALTGDDDIRKTDDPDYGNRAINVQVEEALAAKEAEKTGGTGGGTDVSASSRESEVTRSVGQPTGPMFADIDPKTNPENGVNAADAPGQVGTEMAAVAAQTQVGARTVHATDEDATQGGTYADKAGIWKSANTDE